MKKYLLLHDLDEASQPPAQSGQRDVFSSLPAVGRCIGCFGCWHKTPGICVINDRHRAFAEKMAACDELMIVSRLVYGCYSPPVKTVMDRSIGFILPYFYTNKESGRMCHLPRYDKQLNMHIFFYGGKEAWQDTARAFVLANGENLNAGACRTDFYVTDAEAWANALSTSGEA